MGEGGEGEERREKERDRRGEKGGRERQKKGEEGQRERRGRGEGEQRGRGEKGREGEGGRKREQYLHLHNGLSSQFVLTICPHLYVTSCARLNLSLMSELSMARMRGLHKWSLFI